MRETRQASRVIIRENRVCFRTIPVLVREEPNRLMTHLTDSVEKLKN
jgi:hypothetical protein